jgi:hypothetical protein
MLDELHIEKEPTEVNILTVGGEMLNGFVFVQPYHPARRGPELPVDVLNHSSAYFPLETNEGVVLLAKAAVAEVDYAAHEQDESVGTAPIGVSVSLDITMSGGRSFSGSIAVEAPVNTPRLLDFMNRVAVGSERFLLLRDNGRVRLVNRACIVAIRPLN